MRRRARRCHEGAGAADGTCSTAKILEALAADEDIKEQIAQLAGGIGLEPTDGEAVLRLAQDVAATGDDLAATRKVLAHKRLWIPFALLVLTVGLVGLALALGDDVMRWLRGGAVLATTAFVADVGLVVGRSRRARRWLSWPRRARRRPSRRR